MSFDATSLLSSLFISSIGFVLLSYGRKMSRPPQLIAGLLLVVYPYFVSSVLVIWLVGVGIGGLLWIAVQQGY